MAISPSGLNLKPMQSVRDRSPPPPPPMECGQCPRGVLVNVFFGGWMTSRGQCPRGGACECCQGGG